MAWQTMALSGHPMGVLQVWLPETTPGCASRKALILRAPRNRSDAHLFLLVQMHHTILEQFTLFVKQSSS